MSCLDRPYAEVGGLVIFNAQDYARLHSLVYREGYPGYKPEVRELPNGDGKVDAEKRYAHVAQKDLTEKSLLLPLSGYQELYSYLCTAHAEATRVAEALNVPAAFMPDIRYGALRVLEYPIGAGSHTHTDFNLFTLLCYRNDPQAGNDCDGSSPLQCFGEHPTQQRTLHRISPGMHMGEMGALIGLGDATQHYVESRDYVQHSIVYFAIPDHAAPMPNYKTDRNGNAWNVGTWLQERMARSRVTGKGY